MQSAGPSLTSADILWSHSFSLFISFSMYSFHESLIPLSSTITFPDAPFIQFNPVISCPSLTKLIIVSKKALYLIRSHRSKTHYTHTHPFDSPFSGTIQVSRYRKGKTNLDFTEAKDDERQWHQLGHMQVCTVQLQGRSPWHRKL